MAGRTNFSCVAGAPVGSRIGTIQANDIDTHPHLEYSFAPSGNPGQAFSIDKFTGVLSVTRPLDREQSDRYELKISASDGAHRVETATTVIVTDINDNAPVFDKQLYLLALVAEQSGFEKIEPNKVFNAAFVSLGNPAKIVNAPLEKESVEEAYRKLRQLIERYQDPDQGFTARRALFKSDDFSDYDHLSRYGEWDLSQPSKKERLH